MGLCPKSWGSAGDSGKLESRRWLPGDRGGQGDPLLKVSLSRNVGEERWLSRGRSWVLMKSSRGRNGLGVKLRELLGYTYAKAEQALVKGRR